MSLMTNDNYFFKENYSEYVKERIAVENMRATHYIKTNIPRCYLLTSKLVANIIFTVDLCFPCFVEKGSLLCILSYLGQEYSILMEQDGYVMYSYINNIQIIDYTFPLFLIKAMNLECD